MVDMTPEQALAALPEALRSGSTALPSEAEANEFVDKVDEVTRLIEGLREGTLPPSYIDSRVEEKKEKKLQQEREAKEAKEQREKPLTPEREEQLRQRAEELKASYLRKQKARAKFDEYVQTAEARKAETDYAKWDMWCPSDDEDELINKLTLPNSAEFKAMEKDIEERHRRKITARQVAERSRVRGNELFKAGQWAAAYDCYLDGLDHEKPNIALNTNAAMASIKMGCYVQAIQHADKAVRICEFLLEKPNHPLKVKALSRKAMARSALKHYKEAVEALEEAVKVEPDNEELARQLERARADLEEDRAERRLTKAAQSQGGADNGTDGASSGSPSVATLRRLEELVAILRTAGSSNKTATETAGQSEPRGVEPLPPRTSATKAKAARGQQAAAAKELEALLRGSDDCRVYLRQCGGLEALLTAIAGEDTRSSTGRSGGNATALVELLGALGAALDNERNASVAASKGLYPGLAALAADSGLGIEARAAAALQLGNCTVGGAEARRAVGKALAAAGVVPALMDLLGPGSKAEAQASTLTLLQNCAAEPAVRAAVVAAQGHSPADEPGLPVAVVTALLSSPVPLLRERAASLLGNLMMDESLRSLSAAAVAKRLLATVLLPDTPDALLLPALAALSNCLLDSAACEALLAGEPGAGTSMARLARQLLPVSGSPTVAGRAASALSRLVRLPAGREAFLAGEALPNVVAALRAAVNAMTANNHETCSSCCRALAAVVNAGGEKAADAAVRAGSVPALLASVAAAGAPDAAAGNAALCLSDIARHAMHLPLLREADAVATLVTCAHQRQDKSAQKNAAIALARMAQDPACLERLKELHGLEIIYGAAR